MPVTTISPQYLFVGERRSPRAIAMGVTWQNGNLAARTLFDALTQAGIEPARQVYANVYRDDGTLDTDTLTLLRDTELPIVAMGEKAQRVCTQVGVPFIPLIHPAARGAIRLTSRYRAHVAATLAAGGIA